MPPNSDCTALGVKTPDGIQIWLDIFIIIIYITEQYKQMREMKDL
jgi:hypothetical protein